MSQKITVLSPEMLQNLVMRITGSRKYRHLGIPEDTIQDLVSQAIARGAATPSEIEKSVREKLHNLVAPYLGDPDYEKLMDSLSNLTWDIHSAELQAWCLEVMHAHASTRERLSILPTFYEKLFDYTGKPRSILDLACGLNPFAIPWMSLDSSTSYYAYDLHKPRINLIQAFFNHIQQKGAALHDDILVHPPSETTDVAFFFKEAHRFEQRQHGINRGFVLSIPAKYILVSLPTASLTGRHSMLSQDRSLIERSLSDISWPVREILFENEIVFCIEKK